MTRCNTALALALAAMPLSLGAGTEDWLPSSATLTGSETDPPGRYGVASGVWDGVEVPFEEIVGERDRTTFRLPNEPGAITDLINSLSQRMQNDGYELLLSCRDRSCGGFDFRNRLAVLPLPMMFVDLGEFRYLSARLGGPDGESLISFLASASGDVLFVQEDHIFPLATATQPAAPEPETAPASSEAAKDATVEEDTAVDEATVAEETLENVPEDASDLAEQFAARGETVLEGISFPSGSTALPAQDYPALQALAVFLQTTPDVTIALVGHTDNTGSLDSNVSVSRRRAQAVADRLISEYGVSPGRLSVHGIGYLAPRADNRSEAGQELNRRVTAVLLPS
ncbi:MAG: OmpA family protein [Pseudomonadota bacterium]